MASARKKREREKAFALLREVIGWFIKFVLQESSFLVNLEEIIALHHLTHADAGKAHRYIKKYGSVTEALHLAPEFNNWREEEAWKKDLEQVHREKVGLVNYFDKNYPVALKVLADPPLLLYVKGEIEEKDRCAVAIVGTRQSSFYGLEMAEKFGSELAECSFCVISGFARGVDTGAHRGALKKGRTIALLGAGLSHIYPAENRALAEELPHRGALVSEYPMDYSPKKHFFPKRNRLVSALSQAVLLIEAPLKSGAMITMEMAASQNKICFAMPGPIDRENFRGNHSLIKSGKAQLVENVQDMLSLLVPGKKSVRTDSEPREGFLLGKEEELLLKALSCEEICLEEIALRVDLPMSKLNSLLMQLVLKRLVKEYPGKFYKKVTI